VKGIFGGSRGLRKSVWFGIEPSDKTVLYLLALTTWLKPLFFVVSGISHLLIVVEINNGRKCSFLYLLWRFLFLQTSDFALYQL
jgi:hypothetical protein